MRTWLLAASLLCACGDDTTGGADLAGSDLKAAHDLAVAADLSTGGPVDLAGADLSSTPSVTVTWSPGCWYNDGTHRYQGMSFSFTAAAPVPLEGSLFFKPNCDPSGGIDNLNDTGGTTPPGNWTFWFIHHPDITGSSAYWSLGDKKSACINYDGLPDC